MTMLASPTGTSKRARLRAAGPARALFATLTVALAVALFVAPSPAAAQSKSVPETRRQIELSYASLVKRVAPAVVNVYTKKVIEERSRSPLLDDPFFRRFFGGALPGVPRSRQRVQNSLGSGVIVDPDGLVITNNHVIEGADQITVVLSDRREIEAQVVLADARTDLAVLKIETGGEKLPALALRDSDELEVGDLVLAIGNPFGVGQTVTSGIVSALARTQVGVSDYQFFIQTDAAINPGNSGGALVTMDGRLAGVNTAIYSRSGGSVGIGFAIPANMAAAVLKTAKGGGKLVRPWLGASGQPVTRDLAASLGLDRPGGVVVSDTYPGGPADKAGLRRGDVIVAVDGREIIDTRALRFRIATLSLGEKARLTVIRNGARRDIVIDLVGPPEDPPRNVMELRGDHPFNGAVVGSLSPVFADELELDTMISGVIVLKVRNGSPAGRTGLRPGDIFVYVDGKKIKTVENLRVALKRHGNIRIGLRRGDRTYKLVLGG